MNLVNGATNKSVLDRFMNLDISDCGKVNLHIISIREYDNTILHFSMMPCFCVIIVNTLSHSMV